MIPTEITDLTLQETKVIEHKIITLSDRAMLIKVTDDASLLIADAVKQECLALRKTIVEFFKPLKQKAHDAHKAITTAESAELNKIVPGEDHVKDEMNTYQLRQKQIREKEEARLQEKARKREEQDRLDRAAQVEKEAAALAAAGNVEEAAAVQQEAEKILETPVYVPPVKIAAGPKVKSALKMIVDRDRLQAYCDMLTEGKLKSVPDVPGVRFYQQWMFEVHTPANVPETWRKPS